MTESTFSSQVSDRPDASLFSWRYSLARRMFQLITFISLPAILASTYYAFDEGTYSYIPIYIGMLVAMFVVAFWKRVSDTVRIWGLMMLIYFVVVLDFYTEGRGSLARTFLLAFAFMGAIFFGRRGAIVSAVLGLVTMATFAFLFTTNALPDYQVTSTTSAGWISNTVIVAVLISLIVYSVNYLVSEMTKFLARSNQINQIIEAERAMLEQRVVERTKALTNVAEISTVTSGIQNLNEMLANVVHLTQRRFGLYHAHIFLYDDETEELRIIACGWKEGDEHEGTHGMTVIPVSQEQSLVARAARTKLAVVINDVHSDPGWLPNALLPDTASELAVPLLVGDRLLGVLDVQSDRMNAFSEADVDVQSTLGAQVAVAIQNIQQYEDSQKIASDLGVVAQVGIATATITDIGKLLQDVVDLSKKSFNLYHAHIYMMNETGDTLTLTAGAGDVGRQMVSEGRSIPLNSEKSLVARAARTEQGVTVNDVTTDPDFLPHPLLPQTRSELAVPMIVSNRVIGVLDVQSEIVGRFTELDVSVKTTLASQIAVAVQNARTFEESRRNAEREAAVNLISQRIQSTNSIEQALKVAARELGHALGMKPTAVTIEASALGDGSNE